MNKTRIKRILAFFISGLIIFGSLTVISYATVATQKKPSFTPVPSFIPGDLTLDQAYEIIDKGISGVLAAHGLSESSVEASFYDMMYQKLITDECHLSYYSDGSGPHEFEGTYCLYSSPGVWNEDYLTYFVLTLSSSWIYYDVNTFLDYARARLSAEYSASTFKEDDYVQKDPVSIKSDIITDFVTEANTMFFPKNTGGKMSYRTDKRWHNKYDGTSEKYLRLSLYESFNGFTAVGGDEIYFIFFYKTADDTYYGSYQFHLTVTAEEKWFEDRDEVEFTYYQLKGEYWDMVEGSADKRTDFTPTQYYTGSGWVDFATNTCQYFDLSFLAENYSIYTFGLYSDYPKYLSYDHLPRGSIGCNWPVYPSYNSDMSLSLNIDGTLLYNFDMTSDYADIGYLASTTPIETIYKIDTSKIPDNYYITIQGDNIYDYSITNPETGQSDTINNYITNNYTYVTNNGGDNSGSGGVGGNVTVGGKVDIGGSVGVDINISVPDININVNTNNGGEVGGGSDLSLPNTDIFNSYYDEALDESSDFRRFIEEFFGFLPPEITLLLGIGLTFVILARIFGR